MPSDAATESPPKDQQPTVRLERPCKTVTAHVFNKRVRVLDQITGRRHHKASRKVCKSHYAKLGARVRKARAHCIRRSSSAIASVYGPGYGDSASTASGVRLTDATVGVAHKSIAFFTRFYFHYRGRTMRAPVIDRGPYIAGRTWDLTEGLRVGLGFPIGVDAVVTSSRNCWAR